MCKYHSFNNFSRYIIKQKYLFPSKFNVLEFFDVEEDNLIEIFEIMKAEIANLIQTNN